MIKINFGALVRKAAPIVVPMVEAAAVDAARKLVRKALAKAAAPKAEG